MTGEAAKISEDARRRMDAYLDAIDRALADAGAGRPERRNITDDVEAQIMEMLASRACIEAGAADVEAVIAELDPPAAYAVEAGAAAEAPAPPPPPPPPGAVRRRMCLTAVMGVLAPPVLLAASPLAVAVIFQAAFDEARRAPVASPSRLAGSISAGLHVVPLCGAVGMVAMTILGVVAIRQIRRSAGRLYGMGLAVFDALCLPLLLLDGLVILAVGGAAAAASRVFLGGAGVGRMPVAILLAVMVPVCAAVDCLIARAVWRAAVRGQAGGC